MLVRADAEQLYEEWKVVCNYPRAKFTKERRRLTSRMLGVYSLEQLQRVLRTAAADPNTRGQNRLNRPFDDMVNIFRNEERVDMYLRMADMQEQRVGRMIPDSGPARSERF